MDMELTYIYHSGFALSGDGFTVIMDYYRDSEDGQAQSDLNRLMDGTFSNQEAGNAGRNRTQRIIAETRKTVCAGQSFSSGSF